MTGKWRVKDVLGLVAFFPMILFIVPILIWDYWETRRLIILKIEKRESSVEKIGNPIDH